MLICTFTKNVCLSITGTLSKTTQAVQIHTEKEYYTFTSTLTETTLTFSASFSGMLLQTENNVKYNLQVAILLDHEKDPYSNYVYIVQMLWTK